MYRDVPERCWQLLEFLFRNGGLGDFGVYLGQLESNKFTDDDISVSSRAFLNPEWDPDRPENGQRTIHLIEFGIEDENTNKIEWKYYNHKQLPYRYGYQRARLTKYGGRAVEWRRVCKTGNHVDASGAFGESSQLSPQSASKMLDGSLIPVWAEIWKITGRLSRWGVSPLFIPGVGDVLVANYSSDALVPLRAILEVHWQRIEPELPADLRNKSWVDLLDPAHVLIKDRASFIVAKMRVQFLESLREAAHFSLEKHRSLALVDKEPDIHDKIAASGGGSCVQGDPESSLQDAQTANSLSQGTSIIEKNSVDPVAVDFPNPSAPLSKKNAADAWGGDMTVKKLSQFMKARKIRYKKLNRETFIFCRDDVPNLPER